MNVSGYHKLHESSQLISLSRSLREAAGRGEKLPQHQTALSVSSEHLINAPGLSSGADHISSPASSPAHFSRRRQAHPSVQEREEVVSDLEDVNGNIALRSVDKLQHGDHQDSASYKELYNECFVSAFAEDLDTLREAGANGKLVLNTIVATSKAFLPSDWQALRRM